MQYTVPGALTCLGQLLTNPKLLPYLCLEDTCMLKFLALFPDLAVLR